MTRETAEVLAGLMDVDPSARRRAARQFATLRLADPVGTLAPLLRDGDAHVRAAAIDALDDISDPRAVPLLLELAATDPAPNVREDALSALSPYRGPDVLARLLAEAARPGQPRRARQTLAEQLGHYHDERAVDALVELLDDDDVLVQERAIESLSRQNRPRLHRIWALLAQEWRGTHWGTLAEDAIAGLGDGVDAYGSDMLLQRKHAKAAAQLASADAETRRRGVRLLAFLRPPSLPDRLLAHAGDPDARVRAVVARALGSVASLGAVPSLLRMARGDLADNVRCEAIRALGAHRSPEIHALLLDMARPPLPASADVRGEVALALGDYDDEASVDALLELLRDENVGVRNCAADALAQLDRPRLRDTWRALEHEPGALGRTAREALRTEREPRAPGKARR
jgi:HEAT repeat protein